MRRLGTLHHVKRLFFSETAPFQAVPMSMPCARADLPVLRDPCLSQGMIPTTCTVTVGHQNDQITTHVPKPQ